MKKIKRLKKLLKNSVNFDELRFYHYTFYTRLLKIIDCGYVRTTGKGIDQGERPVVWVSTHEGWEKTLNKLISAGSLPKLIGRDELFQRRLLLPARVEINPATTALHPWGEFKKTGGITQFSSKLLEEQGLRMGANPTNWFVSFENIPSSSWLSIEVWDGEAWITDIHSVAASDPRFLNPAMPDPTPEDEVSDTLLWRLMEGLLKPLLKNHEEHYSGLNRKMRRSFK
jgi:hypothetical protein